MRYQVIRGSESGHCCFEATVVDTSKPEMVADTSKPEMMGNKHYQDSSGRYHYEEVCECMEEEDAVVVCYALNKRCEDNE